MKGYWIINLDDPKYLISVLQVFTPAQVEGARARGWIPLEELRTAQQRIADMQSEIKSLRKQIERGGT